MEMRQDGVRIDCLPFTVSCLADEQERSPLDLDECPNGCEVCTGDCMYYAE